MFWDDEEAFRHERGLDATEPGVGTSCLDHPFEHELIRAALQSF